MKLTSLFEAQKLFVVDASAKDFLEDIERAMEQVADSYAHEVTDPISRPSAPDTSKFRATVSGMIQVEHNVHIHGGQYGIPRTYSVFLKIGGRIDHKIATEIKNEVVKRVAKIVDDPTGLKIPASLYCDDKVVGMEQTEGSNWGGIGFNVRKYSDYEQKQRDAYDLGD